MTSKDKFNQNYGGLNFIPIIFDFFKTVTIIRFCKIKEKQGKISKQVFADVSIFNVYYKNLICI